MPIKNLQVPAPKRVGRQKKIIEPTSSEAPSEFPVPKKGRPKKPEETEEVPKPEPKRRGRPKKTTEEEVPKPEPKRRGRPKKNTNELNEQVQPESPSESSQSETSESSEVDPEYLRKQLLIIEQIQRLQS